MDIHRAATLIQFASGGSNLQELAPCDRFAGLGGERGQQVELAGREGAGGAIDLGRLVRPSQADL
jgi:hypothetical protein